MDETPDWLIVGAGGHGRVIAGILRDGGATRIAFLDDHKVGSIFGHDVEGTMADIDRFARDGRTFVIAIGDNLVRADVFARVVQAKGRIGRAVHPSCIFGEDVVLSDGVVAMAGVIVNPGSRVRENACLNTGARIDHDCDIGAHVHIAPGAILTGNVTVGDLSFVGAGAVITPGRTIGRSAIVGAGAVVVEDVPDYAVVRGVPARVARYVSPP